MAVKGEKERTRLAQVIRRYRLAAGLEQGELARRLGCTPGAVGAWESGRTRPSLELVAPLCRALKLPIHLLMGTEPSLSLSREDEELYQLFHALSAFDRDTVMQLMRRLVESRSASARNALDVCVRPFADSLCPAAGMGVPAPDYVEMEPLLLRSNRAIEQSDIILRVNGDSMAPSYPNGALVCVKRDEETPVGEVGIFVVNGEMYIKERRARCLYSRNRAYPDIALREGADIRNYARVLGIVRDEDVLEEAQLQGANL